ncbi:MAG: sigma-70 family RNA polymerase sigma factor [Odoribacter sp.]
MQKEISFDEIRKGNMEIFNLLFKKYFASMCIVARRFISDTHAAEDIVQDIFIRLWEKKLEYKEIPNLQVFLYVLVKNRCLDQLRTQKKMVDYTQTEAIHQEEIFQDLVVEEEIYRIVDEAIASLATQSARIMKMTLEGKQNKEIAEILNISVNSVKTLKYNALHTMRNLLQEKYYLLFLFFLKNF